MSYCPPPPAYTSVVQPTTTVIPQQMVDPSAPPAYAPVANSTNVRHRQGTIVTDPNPTTVTLTINGQPFTADVASDPSITPNMSLAEFIRQKTRFTGTKIFCHEGGCGVCTVAVSEFNDHTLQTEKKAIHSCLRPLFRCNGLDVTTNDGLGNAKDGYHPIQQRLADHNGSQCGYCSNGFVMTMYSLLSQNRKTLTELDIVNEFDGNLCRCTGYRPIMDAMKTFATKPHDWKETCAEDDCRKVGCKRAQEVFGDIEDLKNVIDTPAPYLQPETNQQSAMSNETGGAKLSVTKDGQVWQDCPTLNDLYFWLPWYVAYGKKIMLVVGGTSLGIYPEHPPVRLFIGDIPELKAISQSVEGIKVGAAATFAMLLDYLNKCKTEKEYQTTFIPQFVKHLKRVGSVMIRNAGSVLGNVMVSKNHQSDTAFFASDAATLLCGLGATFNVVSLAQGSEPQRKNITIEELYATDFATGKFVESIDIPWSKQNEVFVSYKIAQRKVNSHAFVNAAMRVVVDPTSSMIVGQPIVAYGGIEPRPTRYAKIEKAMMNADVTDSKKFSPIVTMLQGELAPAAFTGRQEFRKNCAVNYFYKMWLSLIPETKLSAHLKSGLQCWYESSIPSQGAQYYSPTDASEAPVSTAMPKLMAIQQTSGHAKYTGDLAAPTDMVYAVFVLSTKSNCALTSIDSSVAEKLPGFVAFYDAKTLPKEKNVWHNGEIFASSHLEYCGQSVAAVVATTPEYAASCADAVVVNYGVAQAPITTIHQAVAAKSVFTSPVVGSVTRVPKQTITSEQISTSTAKIKTITDTVEIGYQVHYHMENHIARVIPREDVLEVHCATQMGPNVQKACAAITGRAESKIVVSTKRCGGGYGGKLSNSLIAPAMACFIADDLQIPVQFEIDLQHTSKLLGGRGGKLMNYTIKVDETTNKIQSMTAHVNDATGVHNADEYGALYVLLRSLDNAYYIPELNFGGTMYKLNLPSASPVRGPGWVPAVQLMESVISNTASELGVDPMVFRETNFFKKGQQSCSGQTLKYWNMPEIWQQLKEVGEVEIRKKAVGKFNSENRWIKQGLAMTPVKFGVAQSGANFDAIVSVYGDGTVGVTHGGTEIGQGINTKVAQVVGYAFGFTKQEMIDMVTIHENDSRNLSSAGNVTGGSVSSELCGLAVMNACNVIKERLKPLKTQYPTATWKEIISGAERSGIQLTASAFTNAPNPTMGGLFNYNSNSAAVCQVQVDALTGEVEVQQVDIVFDCGISLNPMVDIGQVEGGFMFGLGYYTLEEVEFSAEGQNMNYSTWEYKIPSAYNVPTKFNITLLKNSPNPVGVLSSKASGEPGVALGSCVVQAIEDAVTAAREANGLGKKRWVCKKTPVSVNDVQSACGSTPQTFVF